MTEKLVELLDINTLLAWQQDYIVAWEQGAILAASQQLPVTTFKAMVLANHAFNYQLRHAEDRARREDQGYDFVYHAKREIDGCNQKRNNCIEFMDQFLFEHLAPADSTVCPVNSETPGMMIDRLSILSLKEYYMHQQVNRQEVDETHRQNCLNKYLRLQEQKKQLALCLSSLLKEVLEKTRTFRLYFQFKMYNDPNLNPQLYAQSKSLAETEN